MRRLALSVALLIASGCAAAAPAATEETQCERDVSRAATIDPMMDAALDLDPAITSCGSLAELEAAGELYPAAFDGADVGEFVRNRCPAVIDLQASAICEAIRD